MIYANSSWGLLLHEHGVPGIYRTQGSGNGWAARMQVRMLTHAAPHQGLGVDQYAWSTSPLRRYTDLVNQWQLLACLKHGVTAPLVAPFKARDADLFAIVSAFDAAYAAYADFQNIMEHYWCLRWLSQHEARKVQAVQIKDDLLKLIDIPLILPIVGVKHPRGTQLMIELIAWDEVDLSVQARFLEVSQAVLAVEEDSDFEEGDSTDQSEQIVAHELSVEKDANASPVIADPVIHSDSGSSTSSL
jgi:exoribonuclease-2